MAAASRQCSLFGADRRSNQLSEPKEATSSGSGTPGASNTFFGKPTKCGGIGIGYRLECNS